MQDRRENEADAPCSSYTEYPRELRARRPTRVCYVGRLAAGCRLIPLRDLSASIGELLKSPVGELLSVAQRQRDRTAGSAAGCATVPYCAQISRKGRNEALAPAIPASSWLLFVAWMRVFKWRRWGCRAGRALGRRAQLMILLTMPWPRAFSQSRTPSRWTATPGRPARG